MKKYPFSLPGHSIGQHSPRQYAIPTPHHPGPALAHPRFQRTMSTVFRGNLRQLPLQPDGVRCTGYVHGNNRRPIEGSLWSHKGEQVSAFHK